MHQQLPQMLGINPTEPMGMKKPNLVQLCQANVSTVEITQHGKAEVHALKTLEAVILTMLGERTPPS